MVISSENVVISSGSTQSATTVLDENYGRVAVRLNREQELIANGILQDRPISEASAVVTGIIEELAERGKWESTLRMLQSPTKLLYDGSAGRKEKLETLLAKGIKSESMVDPERREEIITTFRDAGYSRALYQIAQRKDITPEATLSLLVASKGTVDELVWANAVEDFADDMKTQVPAIAHEAYKMTGNTEGMRESIQSALKNPVEQYKFLERITEEQRRNRTPEINMSDKNIALQAIQEIVSIRHIKNARKEKIGMKAYQFGQQYGALPHLARSETERLEEIASESIDRYHADDETTPKRIKILWAVNRWKEDPEKAYNILKRLSPESETLPEVVLTLWRKEHPEEEVHRGKSIGGNSERQYTTFSQEELQHIYSKTPEKNVEQRELLARNLGDKKELERIAISYAKTAGRNEHKNEKVYNLFIAAGIPYTDERVVTVRNKIIKKEISDAKKDGSKPSPWGLQRNDVEGCETFYEELMKDNQYPQPAYELAKQRGWTEKTERARVAIVETRTPEEAIRYFKQEKDIAGVQTAIIKLSNETKVPVAELEKLVALEYRR